MKLFPKSPWAYFRPLAVIVAVLLAVGLYYRLDRIALYMFSDKQKGDVLMQSLPHSELVDAIESASQSPWSHCGILVRRDGHWQVAQALGNVHYTPLIEYLNLTLGDGRETTAIIGKATVICSLMMILDQFMEAAAQPVLDLGARRKLFLDHG